MSCPSGKFRTIPARFRVPPRPGGIGITSGEFGNSPEPVCHCELTRQARRPGARAGRLLISAFGCLKEQYMDFLFGHPGEICFAFHGARISRDKRRLNKMPASVCVGQRLTYSFGPYLCQWDFLDL